MISLKKLNSLDANRFVRMAGRWFEKSPWVALRTFAMRPFTGLEDLHRKLCDTVRSASRKEQLDLINAHPDLVAKIALTTESTREQAAAGLGELSAEEIEAFGRYNAAYRDRFGFTFIICARENKKDAILAAFPKRLQNSCDEEIETALNEIFKIARLRMLDAVSAET